MKKLLFAAVFAMCACGSKEEEVAVEVPSIVMPDTPAQHVLTTVVVSGDAVAIELSFFHLSELHRGFFGDSRFVGQLGKELGACLSDTASVVVSYDNETRIGRIVLKVPKGSACEPTVAGGTVHLDPLVPMGVALANYRNNVAQNFDLRVDSFKVGVSMGSGARQCTLEIAGSHPPSGRLWSPCIGVAGAERCTGEARNVGVLKLAFSPEHASAVSTCFGP